MNPRKSSLDDVLEDRILKFPDLLNPVWTTDSHMDPDESDQVAALAVQSFWETVVKYYPEAKTGDLSPIRTGQFDDLSRQVVKEWVSNNLPPKG